MQTQQQQFEETREEDFDIQEFASDVIALADQWKSADLKLKLDLLHKLKESIDSASLVIYQDIDRLDSLVYPEKE